jgi:hypothetical protein
MARFLGTAMVEATAWTRWGWKWSGMHRRGPGGGGGGAALRSEKIWQPIGVKSKTFRLGLKRDSRPLLYKQHSSDGYGDIITPVATRKYNSDGHGDVTMLVATRKHSSDELMISPYLSLL